MADFDPSWADAIASIESGGQKNPYSTVTPSPGGRQAYGKYQVMGENIPEWTQAALGQSLTPEQFLNNPGAQDAVFKHRFGGYVDQYGSPQDAASAWFTGRPISASSASARDSLGTTGSDYVNKFNAALDGPTAIQQAMHQQGGGGMQPMAYANPGALSTQATTGPGVLAGGAAQQPQGLLGMLGLPDSYGGRSISNRLTSAGAALESVYNPSGAAALNQQIKAPAGDFTVSTMPDGTIIRVNKQTGAVEKLPGNYGNDSSSKWGIIGMSPPDKYTGKSTPIYGYPPSSDEYNKTHNANAPDPAATPAVDNTPPPTGQAYLDQLTKDKGATYASQVQAIIDGRAAYPTGSLMKTQQGMQLAQDVTQADPSFETGNATARVALRNKFNGGTIGDQITAGNTAIQHAKEMSDAIEGMKGSNGENDHSGVPFASYYMNAAHNAALPGRGTPESNSYNDFLTARNHYAEEVTKFYSGSSGSEAEKKRALDNLDAAKSLPELRSAIQEEAKLMSSKVNALQSRWRDGMDPLGKGLVKDFPLLKPESQSALAAIAKRNAATSGTPAATPAAPQTMKTSNGVSWSLN